MKYIKIIALVIILSFLAVSYLIFRKDNVNFAYIKNNLGLSLNKNIDTQYILCDLNSPSVLSTRERDFYTNCNTSLDKIVDSYVGFGWNKKSINKFSLQEKVNLQYMRTFNVSGKYNLNCKNIQKSPNLLVECKSVFESTAKTNKMLFKYYENSFNKDLDTFVLVSSMNEKIDLYSILENMESKAYSTLFEVSYAQDAGEGDGTGTGTGTAAGEGNDNYGGGEISGGGNTGFDTTPINPYAPFPANICTLAPWFYMCPQLPPTVDIRFE